MKQVGDREKMPLEPCLSHFQLEQRRLWAWCDSNWTLKLTDREFVLVQPMVNRRHSPGPKPDLVVPPFLRTDPFSQVARFRLGKTGPRTPSF
jgi:hypothetical protein